MPKSIRAAVGRHSANASIDDVATVQNLLNCVPKDRGGPAKELRVNGLLSEATIQAITRFQKACTLPVDGRVEPSSPKLLRLQPFVREVLMPAHPDRQPVLDSSACSVPLKIRRSPIHGFGLFAATPIPVHGRIIEYTGQLIDDAEARRRSLRPPMFLLRLGPNCLIDGGIGGSGAECANHACHPNMAARRDGDRALLFSARPIDPGEELVWDYGMMRGTPFRCQCRAPDCRAQAAG